MYCQRSALRYENDVYRGKLRVFVLFFSSNLDISIQKNISDIIPVKI